MELALRGSLQRLRRRCSFVNVFTVRQAERQRDGGVESDGPPKKLFVAGITDPANRSSYTVRSDTKSSSTRTKFRPEKTSQCRQTCFQIVSDEAAGRSWS
ncbi:hypothetical protein F2P81_024859 [Scophthalmus maximus]|uniref:Uncharacterized protein n=1 Tax=Scophthalmus maximus TaxID=52904 RepID=A0A6A4RS58_SCOMX|nr:hypothetical protein F2P81_024859 [Scophthalmus maximus]